MKAPAPPFSRLLRDPRLLLAFGFGSGLAPKAPGTAGTLVAVPFYLALAPLGPWPYLVALLLISLLGVHLCGYAADALGVHDHGGIVWDEIAGCLLCYAPLLLLSTSWPLWLSLAVGFGLFRLFDILKPWPIGWLDRRVGGGAGIMVDDLVAGLGAALVLTLLLTVF